MTAEIVDMCPECDSLDVVDTHGNAHARYQRPRYYCRGCGVRFDHAHQFDKVLEERV